MTGMPEILWGKLLVLQCPVIKAKGKVQGPGTAGLFMPRPCGGEGGSPHQVRSLGHLQRAKEIWNG